MSALLTRLGNLAKTGPDDIYAPPGGFLTGTAIAKGDFVTVDANGRVTQSAAANANVGAIRVAVANQSMAAAIATGTAIEMIKPDDDTLIRLPLTNAGATVAWNVNMIGKQFELRNAAGTYCVDTNANTNKALEIVQLDLNTPSADAFPAVWCRLLPAFRLA